MCDQCYELRLKVPKILKNKNKYICSPCNSTTTPTITLPTFPTPCKSCTLFALLHQNTQAVWWKTIMNASQPSPQTQYHPILTAPKGTKHTAPQHVHTLHPLLSNHHTVPQHVHTLHTPPFQSPIFVRVTTSTFNIYLPPPSLII